MDLFGDDESDDGRSTEALPIVEPVGRRRLKKSGARVRGSAAGAAEGDGITNEENAGRKGLLKNLAKKRAAEVEAAGEEEKQGEGGARKKKRVVGGRSSRRGEGPGGASLDVMDREDEDRIEAREASAAMAAAEEALSSKKALELNSSTKKGKGKATVAEVTKDIFGDDSGDSDSDAELEPEDLALLDDTELVKEEDGDFDDGLIEDERDADGDAGDFDKSLGKGKVAAQGESEFDQYFSSRRLKKVQRSHDEIKEEVVNFITRMDLAADADVDANRKGHPCVSKLKMCKEVLVVMRKRGLGFILLDEGVLSVLSNWLALMPDGSLPSEKVRNTVLDALVGFHIPVETEEERAVIKKSGIAGRIMLLTRIPEESEERKTIAHELLKRWSRPIFRKNIDFMDAARADRANTTVDSTSVGKARPSGSMLRTDGLVTSARAAAKHSLFKKGIIAAPSEGGASMQTRMPAPLSRDYVVRPDNNIVHGSSLSESQRDAMRSDLKSGMTAKMTNKMRNIRQGKTKSRNAQQVSVEGRGMYM